MMIMEDSKMSKIELDLKAIMYSAYDTPHKLLDSNCIVVLFVVMSLPAAEVPIICSHSLCKLT